MPSASTSRLIAGAVLSLLVGVHCGERVDSKPIVGPPPVAVELMTVEATLLRDVVDFVGQLDAEESVLVKPETEGVIESVEFEEGAEAKKGAVLFRLRDGEEQARLREAEARLVLTQDEYQRMKTLVAKGTVSASEFDRASAEWHAAEARRDRARVELARMEIRAPFDGMLGARLVSPGDRVDPNTALVQIDALQRLRLVFSVPEMAVTTAHPGIPLTVSVVPWPDDRFPGEVYFVAPSLDPQNRRLLVKAWVPNPTRKLRPGFFANIQVEIARRDGALVIPEAAVAYDASGPFVWRVDDNDVAERVGVKLGLRRDGTVEIVSGITAGDRIVSAGVHKVAPGAKVQLARAVQRGGPPVVPPLSRGDEEKGTSGTAP